MKRIGGEAVARAAEEELEFRCALGLEVVGAQRLKRLGHEHVGEDHGIQLGGLLAGLDESGGQFKGGFQAKILDEVMECKLVLQGNSRTRNRFAGILQSQITKIIYYWFEPFGIEVEK